MSRRRCSWCNERGHNRRTCPEMKSYVERNPNGYYARMYNESKEKAKVRKCSFCKQPGHTRRTCPTLQSMKVAAVQRDRVFRKSVVDFMKENGIFVGALVEAESRRVWAYTYDDEGKLVAPQSDKKVIGMIKEVNWEGLTYRAGSNHTFIMVEWIDGYRSTGRDGTPQKTHVSLYCLDYTKAVVNHQSFLDKYKVVGPVSAATVEANKPKGWEKSCTKDFDREFKEYGASMFPELRG